jgi:hypothetical protein
MTLPGGIIRELWVRGPERAWHRYRILPETIEEVIGIPQPVASINEVTGKEEGKEDAGYPNPLNNERPVKDKG